MATNEISSGYETTCLCCIFIGLLLYLLTRRRPEVPPGPRLWPVIGNLPSLSAKNITEAFSKLRRGYGDIFGVYIGSDLTVVLNGYDAIHEALVMKGRAFAKRPVNRFSKLMLKDVCLVFENGVKWKQHRNFALRALHELCFTSGNITIEDRVVEELKFFTKEMKDFAISKELIDLSRPITLSCANVMYQIIHGKRAGYDNEKFKWYVDLQEIEHKLFCRNRMMHCLFPFLIKLPGDILNSKRARKISGQLKQYFDDICSETIAKYEEGDRNCLVDIWLTEMHELKSLDQDNLWKIINEITASGSETTATVFKWAVLCLAKCPEIQDKLRREIDKKIPNAVPTLQVKQDLPLAVAIIYEALRIGNVVPLSVPHSVKQDTMLRGYLIPRNTTILPNFASINFDPVSFPDPDKFKPERFLSNDGQSFIKPEKFIPFSLGPRSCLGETIAINVLFLYLTTLVQKFEFQECESEPLPDLSGVFGLTNRPQPFKVRLVCRN